MKKRRLILSLVVLGIGAVILLVQWRSPREPVYQGKPISAWVLDLNGPDPLARSNAGVALHAMGPAAVPFLVQSLSRRESVFKQPYRAVAPKLPLWLRRWVVQRLKPFDALNDRLMAVNALTVLGTNAPVLPLVIALGDPERIIAGPAAAALGNIGRSAVPELIHALNDRNSQVRSLACYALSIIGPDAGDAAAALIQRLTDRESSVALSASHALERLGKPGLWALIASLRNPDERIRAQASRALGNRGLLARAAESALIEVTKDAEGLLRSTGHRIADVVALDQTLDSAIAKAYANIRKIRSLGSYYRPDVGQSLWPPGSS